MPRTGLYRLWDADGDLLYVGIACSPARRFAQHAREKPWWSDVETRTVQWHPTREEALAAERAAILNEWPRHNRVHNTDLTRGFDDPSLVAPQTLGDFQRRARVDHLAEAVALAGMHPDWTPSQIADEIMGVSQCPG